MTPTPEEIVRAQARTLGGGWRMEHGVMPVVVLTTVEAARIIEKLEKVPPEEDLLPEEIVPEVTSEM